MNMVVAGIGQCSLDTCAVVKRYPQVDTKEEVLQWEEQGGGPVATALVTLARFRVATRFAGIVGDDDAGYKILQSLLAEHVDTTYLIEREGSTSQQAFIPVERGSGKRTIFWKNPSGAELLPDELDDEFFRGVKFLLLDGRMKEVSRAAAQKARELNIPVMLDAGSMRDGMLELAKLCDYVVASEAFAQQLGWTGDGAAFAETVREHGWGTTTITFGERGSYTYHGFRSIHVPAFEVDVVDTTGAGDVFHGAYIAGILQGWDLENVLYFASGAAALKCTKIGGRAGIPDLMTLVRFLEQRGIQLA
jgi:ribokinase